MNRTIRCQHGFAIAAGLCPRCASVKLHSVQQLDKTPGAKYTNERCGQCGETGHRKPSCPAVKKERAVRAHRATPNLVYRPIPAEFAEPAPKRRES